MIHPPTLLADLKPLLADLEADLHERVAKSADIDAELRAQHGAAVQAERTAARYEDWRDEWLTQVSAAWILGCVFVRFLEDNALVPVPRLAGPAAAGQRARDEHELYFRAPERRTHSDRDYLLHAFEAVAALPAAAEVFDRAHNPLWSVGPTGDGAARLLAFWRRTDPDSGALIHAFTDPALDTRFLGDLYQDLSEGARKHYALLQTPEFVEAFILDRTLEPAVEQFGLPEIRLIDPTCGSGHFLLGAFARLFDRWVASDPEGNPRALAQRALDQVFGVDLNPFAAAIACFRLLIAALKASGVTALSSTETPAFHVNVAAGDSLLHGPRAGELELDREAENLGTAFGHAYFAEDLPALNRILAPHCYHVVVGNPPYITVKDPKQNALYRARYGTCHRQYSLGVPFTERFFQLCKPAAGPLSPRERVAVRESNPSPPGTAAAVSADNPSPPGRGAGVRAPDPESAGFVGMITANSFMKREFGKKLIEDFLPRVDLTHVIDTSGAYIPGHGTPTVILLGRERRPVADTVRTVMGIRGEPETPADPARGRVWSAILAQVDRPGSEGEWLSVADADRAGFGKHPWSIGGGGASELRDHLEGATDARLSTLEADLGFLVITGEDNCLLLPPSVADRHRVRTVLPIGDGEVVRDWVCAPDLVCLWPYDQLGNEISQIDRAPYLRFVSAYRTVLKHRKAFGVPVEEKGLRWWDIREVYRDRLRTPLSIAFAEVATHNHFVLDRGGKVFKQTAPVIKLPAGAGEDAHLGLLGLLNSSTACFWLKQVCHSKGGQGINEGAKSESWERFYQLNGTKVGMFPVPDDRPLALARTLDRLAAARQAHLPAALAERLPLPRADLDAHRAEADRLLGLMVAWQEELDWHCYRLYGVTEEDLSLSPPHPGPLPEGEGGGPPHPDPLPEGEGGKRPHPGPLPGGEGGGPPHPGPLPGGEGGGPPHPDPLPGGEGVMPAGRGAGSLPLPQGEGRGEGRHPVPLLRPGERAFEIVMARQMARGELSTTWFERHRSQPITEIPAHWPEDYRRLVERRIALIESDRNLGLLERPEHKRRWNQEPWAAREARALAGWLLDRLESRACWPEAALQSTARLAERAAADPEFMQVGERYRGHPEFDVPALVAELVAAESVPLLPVLRYKPSGLAKRARWERTWALQRREDAIDAAVAAELNPAGGEPGEALAGAIAAERKRRKQAELGDIPPPPKYRSADFADATCWRLRGALDVPRERFVAHPFASRDADPSLVVGWAGWNALEQARALAAWYLDLKEREGWTPERLSPVLAGFLELVPWIEQWHNAPDPAHGHVRMGEYFADFLAEEARDLGLTPEHLRTWTPPARARGRRRTR